MVQYAQLHGDLDKPRILCLHGAGVTAEVFELQMRYFIRSLGSHFRLVFADGPWFSEMHPDIKAVYADMGPYRRWGWLPHHPPLNSAIARTQVEESLTQAMEADEGRGEWVGLLGFSQGAKLAFSVLLENQMRLERDPSASGFAGVHWKFGIIMAGRAAPYALSESTEGQPGFTGLTQPAYTGEGDVSLEGRAFPHKLRTPTLHVLGLQDAGLELHRDLFKRFADPSDANLIQWEGAHRIPFKSADVEMITDAILETAEVS